MRYLKFVPAICAAVALGSGVVLGADYMIPSTPPASTSPAEQGIISAINLEKGTVVIVPPGSAPAGTTPTTGFLFFVNAQTKIIKNNQTATLKDLAIGDFCRAEINYSSDGVPFALSVQASSPQPQTGLKFVTGVISAADPATLKFELTVKPGSTGAVTVLKFFADKETKIIKNGHPVGFGDLKVGDMAGVGFLLTALRGSPASSTSATGSPVRAAVIEVKNPVTPPQPGLKFVTGVISAIDYSKLAFELTGKSGPNGTAPVLKFFADKETKIIKNNHPVGFGDLKVGDVAAVGFLPSSGSSPGSAVRAVVIEVKNPVTPLTGNIILDGVITGINLEKGCITLEEPSRRKAAATIFVVDSTKIVKNGQPALLKDLKVGDPCRAEVKRAADGSLVALNMQVKSAATPPPGLKTVTGVISSIDYNTGSTFTLFIKGENNLQPGSLIVLTDTNTKIRKNGNPAGFGDLRGGDLVGVGLVPDKPLGPGSTIHAVVVEAKTPPTTSTPAVMPPR